jgi:hypothetical protein
MVIHPRPTHVLLLGRVREISFISREVMGVNGTELVLVLALGVLLALVVASQI